MYMQFFKRIAKQLKYSKKVTKYLIKFFLHCYISRVSCLDFRTYIIYSNYIHDIKLSLIVSVCVVSKNPWKLLTMVSN